MKRFIFPVGIIGSMIIALIITSCGSSDSKEKTVKEFDEFIKAFEAKYIPLYKETALASWDANISGKDEDYAKSGELDYKLTKLFSDKTDFEKLKKFKESGDITDSLKKRELEILYNAFLGNQVDTVKMKEIIDMGKEIEKKFNTFRAVVGKDTLTDNKIEEILKTSTDSKKLEETWLATKKSGKNVAEDVIKLVKKRNEVAKDLGFSNYHEMKLKLSEQDPNEIEKLFDELDSLTKDGFAKLKNDMDEYFAKHYNVKNEDLMPWHYQGKFFQEAPKIYEVDLDKYYKGKDIIKITEDYFKSIGLDVADLIKNSDLKEKAGKNQHAFCTDIDNEGDVRVLCNVVDNENWMGTMLHEYGHAAYDKYIDRSLPFVLRDPAHTFTTEAIAELFGRFATNPKWLKDVIGVPEKDIDKIKENVNKSLRLQMLVFSRWSQVMYRFEKSMYENPDQDLNKLWWTLVEKYQMLKKPANRNEPDWASKIHIALYPCYYHNYLMGELLASQLHYYMTKNILKSEDYANQSYYNKAEIGKYLIDKVFKPGSKYGWNEMIEKATGEKLTAKYYAKQFVD
ncbi:MAG TPA: M2 family metallopeptidase [Bacteroidales bacterium]|nr:M2 family metallopeptidase [Bacteroidales bacterium]HPS18461.1 M2 family metallopeptidase [Bacteroidales bacterium]